ncbi:ketoreductase [Camillea tinctor]|nr:ketoreductase [Camillea tinctor]
MQRILVTGGSGFIATHVIDVLVKGGYSVLTTVRSESKGQRLQAAYSADKLDFAIVPDISVVGAFDQVCKTGGFDAVLHVASPFHYNVRDPKKDLIDPAVVGTTGILRSIKDHCPNVKRVVVTSSFAAILDFALVQAGVVKTWSEKDWNPMGIDDAQASPMIAYAVSKVLAEKAAWDFVEKEKPGFTLTTITPPLVYGPATQGLSSLSSVNTSNQVMADLVSGKYKDGMPPTGIPLWVDVRDVALAHVRSLERPAAVGKRFFTVAGHHSHRDLLRIVRDNFPELREKLPESGGEPSKDLPSWGYDNSSASEVLGIKWTTFEKSTVDTVKSLLEISGEKE